jgi:hypothetical protein
MTYRAKMIDGEVVFEGGIKPADGIELRVDVVESPGSDKAVAPPNDMEPQGLTVGQRMLKYAGVIDSDNLPEDGSLNVDHYVYGTPKR